MKEFEYEYDCKEYIVSYDKRELEDLLRRLIEEKSFKQHLTFCSPFPNYDKGEKKSNKYIITNYKETSVPLIDVWDYYIWEYDKYTIPYLAYLIKRVLHGNINAFEEICYPVYEKEYIPIGEIINDSINDINQNNKDKVNNPSPRNWFPNSSENVKRLNSRKETIKKCGEILLNDEYLNEFKPYYEEAKDIFIIKEKNEYIKKKTNNQKF